jgi:hypothetical protein
MSDQPQAVENSTATTVSQPPQAQQQTSCKKRRKAKKATAGSASTATDAISSLATSHSESGVAASTSCKAKGWEVRSMAGKGRAVAATRKFNAGDTILVDVPFSWTMRHQYLVKVRLPSRSSSSAPLSLVAQ